MSIEFARSYKTTDGTCHGTLVEAQRHQLYILLAEALKGFDKHEELLDEIIGNSEVIVNILTMSERSRPKARAVNGGRKPRKSRITEPATTTAA